MLALACDPDRDARSIRLALGAQHGRPTHELGIGQLVGVEPLQPGETLEPPVVASGPDGLRGRAAGPARGDPRLLSTTLTHRYRPSSDFDRTRLVFHARVLLVRDAQGIWRLTAVEPLLPLVAVTHRQPFGDAELDRLYRSDAREGRKAAAAAARLQVQRDAATVDGAAAAPCSVALAGDRAGDIVVQESELRARDQRANAGVDMLGVGAAGRCLAIHTAGPLPARFEIDTRGGSRARAAGRSAPSARTRRATSRRCARPTC